MVELMKIPKSVSLITGEQGNITDLIDGFFINSKQYVEQVSDNANDFDFEIKSAEVDYRDIEGKDKLSYLIYKEKYIIAGVLETRTPYNNLHYTFFRDLSFL